MADLVLGAAFGTASSVLYDAVIGATLGRSKKIKFLLGALESTLDSIQPLVIKQIEDYNVKLQLPNDEVVKLHLQMIHGEELICSLSRLRWWNRIKSGNLLQLVELDASLKRLLEYIVMQQSRDIKENLLVAKQTATQLVQFQEFDEKLLRERTSIQEGAKELQEKFLLQLHENGEQLLQLQRVLEDMMMQQEARQVTRAEIDVVSLHKMLFKNIEHLLKQNVTYKPVIRSIKSTLNSLQPVIDTINKPGRFLNNREKTQINSLATEMREGVELFSRCWKLVIGTSTKACQTRTNLFNGTNLYKEREIG